MARPVNAPVSFGFGRFPTDPKAVAIYRRLGLAGHNGDDYAVYLQPTYAVQPGTVVTAGWVNDGGGLSVRIRFKWKDGRYYIAQHDHLSWIDVQVGQEVKEGQQVGITGNSRASTGHHLHFSIWPESDYNPNDGYYGYINPQPFYESQGGSMTHEDVFGACFITQATRWPTKKEEQAWKQSGLPAHTWVQRNAPDPGLEQAKVDAFKACWMTLRQDWPSDEDVERWLKSGLPAYTYCQQNAPNVAVAQKNRVIEQQEEDIRDLHIKLEQCEQTGGADAQIGRKFSELVKEVS